MGVIMNYERYYLDLLDTLNASFKKLEKSEKLS